ncbi:MAG: hypothetical protein EXQ85_09580 [Alphaproteobacteria bacterium]|nr:hypothetical protein [Alphaproteobacteria bacterium]
MLAGNAVVGGRVLVIDEEGGWPAVSLVETLVASDLVASLTVVTSERQLGEGELQWTREVGEVADRLRAAAVAVISGATIARVDGMSVEFSDGRRLGPFDSIVLSTGTTARPVPAGVHSIGECVAPRGLWAATTDALELAYRL